MELRRWRRSSQERCGTQASYQVQVSTASDFHSGTIIADSSVTNTPDATWDIPSSVTLTDGSTYYSADQVSDAPTGPTATSTQFGWGAGDGGTGIDHTGKSATDSDTAESLGFTPLYTPDVISMPCPDGCGGGSFPTNVPTLPRISSTTIFHEQRWNWCVPATLQTMPVSNHGQHSKLQLGRVQ